MSRFRCFIIPFDDDGTYRDEIEVTDDVFFNSMGNVKESVDNNEYDIGVFRFSSFGITLRNDHGKYLDPSRITSIFRFTRSNSIFKIKWQRENFLSLTGVAIAGKNRISPVVDVYEGYLNDEGTESGLQDESIGFQVLGFESIFDQVDVPFSEISNGDTLESVLFNCLNQLKITRLLTVDILNWNLDNNETIDDKSSLENKTVNEALKDLLLLANSILYIKDRVIFITKREASPTIDFKFFGPVSIKGLENILNISKIRTGLSKTFNYWTWAESTIKVEDSFSIAKNNIQKKELSSSIITDTAKRQTLLGKLVTEFGLPKESFTIKTPLNYATLELFMLDKVTVDYPKVLVMQEEDDDLPVYGISRYGQSRYPTALSEVFISDTREFKILGRAVQLKNQTISFELKEVT